MVKKTGLLVIPIVTVALLVGIIAISEFPVDVRHDTPTLPSGSILQVYFLDVGQADCILLKTDNYNMLIDAGNIGQDKLILNYLAEYNVNTLDYLVATHPHADHIGSMASIVRAMDNVGMVIMPDKIHTTKTFENLLKAIEEKNVPVTMPKPGDVFTFGNANIQILAPNSATYNDLNDYSIVLQVKFGSTVFLFTGDADTKSEGEQLLNEFSLAANVLKVGYHGSRTSSTQKYLDAVSPTYAVISCGANNTYGHPHKESMSRLTAMGITIYRTDENGTILFVSDGKEISIITERGSGSTPVDTETLLYIGNKNSKTFHLESCSSLPQEQNSVYFNTRQEAIDAGYTPCGKCKP